VMVQPHEEPGQIEARLYTKLEEMCRDNPTMQMLIDHLCDWLLWWEVSRTLHELHTRESREEVLGFERGVKELHRLISALAIKTE